MRSALYVGSVAHRRTSPKHHFRRRLRLALVYLDEVDVLRSLGLLRRLAFAFRRNDYLGTGNSRIDDKVRDRIETHAGWRPTGPVALLCQLRHFGLTFDPVRVYYCLSVDETRVEALIAEVTNTPWGERHEYIAAADGPDRAQTTLRWRERKGFHVSPFMEMTRTYRFRFQAPAEQLSVVIQSRTDDSPDFVAAAVLQRVRWTRRNMARSLVSFPFMPAQTLFAIYAEALRLWTIGARFYSHPRQANGEANLQERPR